MISSFTEALGWTLLHSLWQASLVALIVYLVRVGAHRPAVVYWAGVTGLLIVVGGAAYTFDSLYFAGTSSDSAQPTLASSPAWVPAVQFDDTSHPPVASPLSSWTASVANQIQPYISWITLAWGVGLFLFSLRFAGGLWYLTRLKHRRTASLPTWEPVLTELKTRLDLFRPVSLLTSEIVRGPMVIGYLKPVILVPAALLSHLSLDQIEAIIAHELAHVRRHDYGINLIQSLVEVIFFYHPAVWWMSALVRAEREKCCDDLAVAACGNSLTYAQALSEAEGWQRTAGTFAPAFASRRSGLLARIERLVHPRSGTPSLGIKLSLVALIVLLVGYASVGDTLTDRGQKWIGKNLFDPSPPTVASAPATSATDTLPDEDDGWRGTDKARTYQAPARPDTVPDRAGLSDTAEEEEDNFTFRFSGPDSTMIKINPPVPPNFSVYVPHSSYNINVDSVLRRGAYAYAFFGDSLPVFSDSRWMESVEELSETMGTFSEELADYLTDSVHVEELQKHLGSIQQEIGQLQAELGTSLRRSFNEEDMELLREELERKQAEVQRRAERVRERVQRQQERIVERQQQAQERIVERQQRAEERRQEAEARRAEVYQHRKGHTRININNKFSLTELVDELRTDGLIKRGRKYRFKLKPSGLYIDGKKQPNNVYQKYRKLLDMSEDDSFSINGTA